MTNPQSAQGAVQAMSHMPKKVASEAEQRWRKERSDERWERRVEYLMEFFSKPSGLLPGSKVPKQKHPA